MILTTFMNICLVSFQVTSEKESTLEVENVLSVGAI